MFVYEAYYNHSPGGSFWKPWFDIMPGNFDGVGAVYDEEDHVSWFEGRTQPHEQLHIHHCM